MPWFRVDDNLALHPKAVDAGNAALGLWVRAGAWSASNLTSGFIPTRIARQLGTKSNATRLVNAGLWIEQNEGYLFHEWGERQRSKADVESEREANRRRQEDWRKKKRAEANAERNGVTPPDSNGVTGRARNGVSNGTPTLPYPSLPITTYVESAADGNVPSARSGAADTFSDDTPMPEEPPRADWDTDGSSALAPVHQLHPEHVTVETGSRPAKPQPTQAARAVVRQVIPGLTRQVIDQLAVHLAKAARDDVPDAAIRTGLERWRDDPAKPNPGALPYRIGDAARDLAAQTAPDQRPAKPSKLRLMAELAAAERARENAQLATPNRGEIE